MNRATAETQKEISQEEGLAPILAFVKALIDDIIADEFSSPDLEFAFATDQAIDPQTQESILTSYATKGILTINEARVALGREPLAEASANRPMVLTGSGYVPLGQEASAAGKSAAAFRKYNPYHDERGLFTSADGAASGAGPKHEGVQVASNDPQAPVQVAQGGIPPELPEPEPLKDDNRSEGQNNRSGEKDDSRGLEPDFDTQQIERLNAALETLSRLDPNRSSGFYVATPGYVPTDQDIADIYEEIGKAVDARLTNFVVSDGRLRGTRGGSGIRNLPGGAKAAQQDFDYLSVGGTPVSNSYPGTMVTFPGSAALVGLRNNKDGIPTIDINVPGSSFRRIRFHYQ